MQVRKILAIHSRFLAPVGIAALAMLALVTPVSAADADDYEGWFGTLDIALTQPNSLDHNFATNNDFSGATSAHNRLTIDSDDDTTFAVAVGYSWGRDKGSLRVSYWNYDNDDDRSGTVIDGFYSNVLGYIGGYGGAYLYDPAGVTFAAQANVEATTIDLDYIRPIATGNNFVVRWLAGIRMAEFEEAFGVTAFDTGVGTINEARAMESDGVGLRVGATAAFGFSDHFALEGELAVSFMQADNEARGRRLSGGAPGPISAEDDNVRGEIRDYSIKAVWEYGHLDYYIGYSVSDWDGMVRDPLAGGTSCCGPGSYSGGRDSISFNSIDGGIRWRFGGGS